MRASTMKAQVHVTLRKAVLDPQGKAIAHGLEALGFEGVEDVRQGKFIEIALKPGLSREEAQSRLKAMCDKLLANPVMEDYRIDILD
jgi:phosphoribosylformylglycinamidine synthase